MLLVSIVFFILTVLGIFIDFAWIMFSWLFFSYVQFPIFLYLLSSILISFTSPQHTCLKSKPNCILLLKKNPSSIVYCSQGKYPALPLTLKTTQICSTLNFHLSGFLFLVQLVDLVIVHISPLLIVFTFLLHGIPSLCIYLSKF